jgi:hypothetical protein
LGATGATDEPLATSARSIGERGIHNLNQRRISGGQKRMHSERIQQSGVFLLGL